MKLLILFCILATAYCAPGPQKRIVNGSNAALGSHPHQASLQLNQSGGWYHICGGSLISRNRILTAAHCVQGTAANRLRIVIGALNLYESPNAYTQTVAVTAVYVHSGYNANGAGIPNDIAVLALASQVTLNANVQVATMATQGTSFVGVRCWITGWGRLSGGGSSPAHLQEVRITKISTSECASRWPTQNVNIRHICVFEASGSNRPSACNGDSGGPMICNNVLAGVTSWGVSTCSGTYPSVYTRVSEYRPWIAQYL